jgi:NTE family protein
MKSVVKTRTQRIALVLQGGGALGAYQAGVYQALHESDLCPDWIVGTSIGAINAAIIAGNRPTQRLARLREFWNLISFGDLIDMNQVSDPARKLNTSLAIAHALISGVPGFFSPRMPSLFPTGAPVPPEMASFYDTSELADTLKAIVDLNFLNGPNAIRLSVNALKVTTGELMSFDSRNRRLRIDHIMASGALPPGFPPVRIDGDLYWDGGMFSNTPLETVLDDEPRQDTLCFMVDLWSPTGPEPCTLDEVQTREKDVTYASRSKMHIQEYLRLHDLRRLVRAMYEQIPPELRTPEERHALSVVGADTTLHIVRLVYAGRDWNMASKDINFSKGSIDWRWQQGYQDATRAIRHAAWNTMVPAETGVVVHELAPPAALLRVASRGDG